MEDSNGCFTGQDVRTLAHELLDMASLTERHDSQGVMLSQAQAWRGRKHGRYPVLVRMGLLGVHGAAAAQEMALSSRSKHTLNPWPGGPRLEVTHKTCSRCF